MMIGRVYRGWSLSVRLGLRLAAVMAVAILLTAVAVAWRAVLSDRDLDDFALQKQAELIVAQLPQDWKGAVPPKVPDSIVAAFRASDADSLFLILSGDRLVASSDPVQAEAVMRSLHHPLQTGFFRVKTKTTRDRSMVGVAVPSGAWHVIVLQGKEQTSVLLQSFTGDFVMGSAALLLPIGLVTILVAVATLRRGLRPIKRLSASAALIGPEHIDARLPEARLPNEIKPLVVAVNKVLDRLEQGFITERRFIGNAAHSMRTPLAVATARLDMMADQPSVDALRQDIDRINRLVSQMLRITRIDSMPLDMTQPVDLHDVVVEAISALVPLGLRKGVELVLLGDPGPLTIKGNHDALVVAVTNLIENALAYAPPGTAVEVGLTAPATVTVRDAGPGVPPQDAERIFRRFERGTKPAEGGAGLGLAIVAELAAVHGGSIAVENDPRGGARFTLALSTGGGA